MQHLDAQSIDSLLSAVAKEKSPAVRVQLWGEIGFLYFQKGNGPGSEYAIQQLVRSATEDNTDSSMAIAYLALGSLYEDKADFKLALKYHFKALQIFEKISDEVGICQTSEQIAVVYNELKNINEGLKYLNKAQQFLIIPAVKNSWLARAIYANKAGAYLFVNQIDSALFYNQKANEVVRSDDPWGYSRILFQFGVIYLQMENYDRAVAYFEKAISFSDSAQLAINLIESLNQYSRLLIKQHKIEVAKSVALRSWNEHKKISNQFGVLSIEITEILSEIYSKFKMYDSAYYYSNFNNSIRDSVYSNQKLSAIEELTFSQNIFAIEEEHKNKELIAQQQLQQQKIVRNSLIAGSILLMLLIVVLINRNKLKRTVEMEKMRSRLSRDLHDDIGSTLSSINILSRTAQKNVQQSGDEKTKLSLEKINERSQRLLDNMSDIIWNINPGNDTIEEVMSRMREYATTILEAKNIDYTFNFPREKMDCTLSMEVKNNMYLIFKEAVNNLSKYSGASKANLSLTFDEKNIHLKIEDNGKGFNEEEIKHRGGLSNMQHRADEIKGEISIFSEINKGTQINLTMPRYC